MVMQTTEEGGLDAGAQLQWGQDRVALARPRDQQPQSLSSQAWSYS